MPELPEVETMCRGLAPVVGEFLVRIERTPCQRRPIVITPRIDRLARRIVGQQLTAVERVGKRVVLWFDEQPSKTSPTKSHVTPASPLRGSEALVIEPRMTGLVLLADPPTTDHLRLRLSLQAKHRRTRELLFWDRRGLGRVTLLSAEEFAARFESPDGLLGPDALRLDVAALKERFCRSRRPIKVALLDQRSIAGVGNLYASEILHLAGIHPALPCHRVPPAGWQRIHAALVQILEEAIRYEGSTLGDGTYRNALNQAGGYQNHHRVYDRAGEPCPRCITATIVRIVQAQRATFFCPRCQKKAGR